MNKQKNYVQLIKQVGIEKFEEYQQFLTNQAHCFIKDAGYEENVICNDRIMLHVLLDYFADIERLKAFHDIKEPRTSKVFAYTIYWILRRKPLQFQKPDIEEEDVFVNERFALFLLINECMMDEVDVSISAEVSEKFNDYLEYVLYYFKYRDCDAQVLELLLETFKMGIEFHKKVS